MSGHIDQLAVPIEFVGSTYKEMADSFIFEDGIISLGLYRNRGHEGAPMPFTQLCPPPETKLQSTDLVFVLIPPKRIVKKKKMKGPQNIMMFFEPPE